MKRMELNCINGVIDLKTGEIRDHGVTDVSPIPTEYKGLDEPAPVWEQALNDIFQGDQDMIAFVQRLFGYGISGTPVESCVPVLWGRGRNGKSLFANTLMRVLGGAACSVMSGIFRESLPGPTPGVISLQGRRLAFLVDSFEWSEFRKARQFGGLVGDDFMQGRGIYDNTISSIDPTHLLVLTTNKDPRGNLGSRAIEDVIHLERLLLPIEFCVSFVDGEPEGALEKPRDKHLSQRLEAEHPGILTWLVRGCLDWQAKGSLCPPYKSRFRQPEDGDLRNSIEICKEKYNIDPQLVAIFENSVRLLEEE